MDPMSAIASDVLGNIAGKKIAVFGLGRSGLAVANVALNRGALVWATDRPAPGLEVAASRAGVAVYVTTAAWPVVRSPSVLSSQQASTGRSSTS